MQSTAGKSFDHESLKIAKAQFKLANELTCVPTNKVENNKECNVKVNKVYDANINDACCYNMFVHSNPIVDKLDHT